MIPSRPLDLGGIIGESIRIVKLTWWRAAIVLFIFWVPGVVTLHVGMNKLIDAGEEIIQQYTAVSPEAPLLIRDYILSDSSISYSSALYFRFQYPDLFSTIDSVKYSVKAKYSDSISREALRKRIDSISTLAKNSKPLKSDDLYSGIFLLLIGSVILLLCVVANIAAQYDLSTRAFENRSLNLSLIFGYVFRRSFWYLLIQYLLIAFIMLFGLGIVVGITFAISSALGAFGFLVSFVIMFYSFFRILFSRVACISEELNPIDALKRSLELTKKIFWRVFGLTLICGIMISVINTFLRLPFSFIFSPNIEWLLQFIKGNNINIPKMFSNFKSMINDWESLFYISALISASFFPAFITTFYYDLRTRHDGVLDYDHSNAEMHSPDSE